MQTTESTKTVVLKSEHLQLGPCNLVPANSSPPHDAATHPTDLAAIGKAIAEGFMDCFSESPLRKVDVSYSPTNVTLTLDSPTEPKPCFIVDTTDELNAFQVLKDFYRDFCTSIKIVSFEIACIPDKESLDGILSKTLIGYQPESES